MRVLLKLILDCDPDAAWRALQSPTVFREVMAPWVGVESEEGAGFPFVWTAGPHPVRFKALSLLDVGDQSVDLSFPADLPDGVRMVRDTGGGRSGLPGLLPRIDHRMAVSPDPAGPDEDGRVRTLYRDRLIVSAGVLTPALWYSLWVFWQWRAFRLRQLAPTWAFDPEFERNAEGDQSPEAKPGTETGEEEVQP